MIFWLIGLAYVIWYGSFRKPVAINPWLWAAAGTLAYLTFGLALYFLLLFAFVLPVSKVDVEGALMPAVVVVFQISVIALASFAATRIYRPLVTRLGDSAKLELAESGPVLPDKGQLTCEGCQKTFPSHYWLKVVNGRSLCAECQKGAAST